MPAALGRASRLGCAVAGAELGLAVPTKLSENQQRLSLLPEENLMVAFDFQRILRGAQPHTLSRISDGARPSQGEAAPVDHHCIGQHHPGVDAG